jgi:hypothetical protein
MQHIILFYFSMCDLIYEGWWVWAVIDVGCFYGIMHVEYIRACTTYEISQSYLTNVGVTPFAEGSFAKTVSS